jgi:beta-lactamase class A/beta-lactamase class A CARB-5
VADALFRAALPPTWSIEDRTGAGEHGTRGIVAVLYPPGRRPIVAATYLRDADVSLAERNAAMARIGRAIVLRTPVD